MTQHGGAVFFHVISMGTRFSSHPHLHLQPWLLSTLI